MARLQPATAYLAILTRPPAENSVHAPDEAALHQALQILSTGVEPTEILAGFEGDAFAITSDVEQDLLSIAAVHPVREDALDAFLTWVGADCEVIQHLVKQGQLVEREYRGHKFFSRKLGRDSRGA